MAISKSRHGPSIKNPKVYDDLREKGYSKKKSAKISNAMYNKKHGKPDKRKIKGKGKSKIGKPGKLRLGKRK